MSNEEIVKLHSNDGREFVNMYDMMDLARIDESDKYAPVIYRESYAEYSKLLAETYWSNDTEQAQKRRTELALAWLEDVLSYYVNKHDGECIKIEITNIYQR